jgi:hypothetical protein
MEHADGRGLQGAVEGPRQAPRRHPASDVQAVLEAVTHVAAPVDHQREIDQRVSNYYYDITKRGFAQATVPQKIFSGEGYLPFGEKADRRRSKYFWS